MYIDNIALRDFRTFERTTIDFLHPDRKYRSSDMPRPKLPNVNLLLGSNGSGKTTLLKAVALAGLGPAVSIAGIFANRLVRRNPAPVGRTASASKVSALNPKFATITAEFISHPQDGARRFKRIDSAIRIERKGDLEQLSWMHGDQKRWHPIYSSDSDAFFFVGYGASRRVEKRDRENLGARRTSSSVRAQRVFSLFEEAYALVPLNSWLPEMRSKNKGRYVQVERLINRLVGKEHYTFTGEIENGEYLFERGGLRVPFPALSDGYRAYLGWIGDLLYHVAHTCPRGKKLVDNRGIVMVDEIDLHLHPEWQLTVLKILAEQLPNIQFIVTSHSPLIVSSLEWMNIIALKTGHNQASAAGRLPFPVHGLDADQVLLTGFFDLQSTRAPGRHNQLKALSLKARGGDHKAANELLRAMARGSES